MNRIKYFLLALTLVSTGCATILKGSAQTVNFSADQTDTKVYVNGQYMGKAPLELPLTSSKSYNIEFRKAGYENKTVVLNNSLGAGWLILDVLGGFIPLIVDAASGAWLYVDRDNVVAALEKN